ncbi:hypothetical protein CSUI_000075 [Cystoisospora suis]|uniref:Uncharacterized protein n=1 Tax=Cystoisospora suis TaxID=483139 RepID=A0A2C6LIK5_9APIC|nr:hypothetical protein CSUI_000075 [Cystoisospora suis]
MEEGEKEVEQAEEIAGAEHIGWPSNTGGDNFPAEIRAGENFGAREHSIWSKRSRRFDFFVVRQGTRSKV